MKPATVFLGEMTTLEVEAFLRDHQTVIVPVGSTEQHGPHGPLLTDSLIPTEVARRAAPVVGAVVAPAINYWDGMSRKESESYFAMSQGLHANRAEISAVMAINPDLVDMDLANA
ncbi:MAG TPA: creatininase family protein, partial [Candidatus Binatus sp.]|nr:creatininase family protein [Candidatus Binatus sp.]